MWDNVDVPEMDAEMVPEDPWGPTQPWMPGAPVSTLAMGGYALPIEVATDPRPVIVTEVDQRAHDELARVLTGLGCVGLAGEPVPGVAYIDLLQVFRRPAWSPSLSPWWAPGEAPKSYRRLDPGGRRARLAHLIRRAESLLSIRPDDEAQATMLTLARAILFVIVAHAKALLALARTLTVLGEQQEPEAIDHPVIRVLAPPGESVITSPIAANAPPRASTPVLFAREAVAA